MGSFQIAEIRTEYQEKPLGLDARRPRFSWKLTSEEGNFKQAAWQVLVGTRQGEKDCWDSGRVESDCSVGVHYEGKELEPCTRYYLTVTVWDKEEAVVQAESWFETGLLDTSLAAWEGAEWIGAPEPYLCAKALGVFVIAARLCIRQGSRRGGLVFGANDGRLMDERKNQYEIAGENYIRYVLDVGEIPARLLIYRVGYHPEDRADVPLASVPVVEFGKGAETAVITEENRYGEHELKVEVIGNCAYAYVDGVLVDAVEKEAFHGKSLEARQLNPLGFNDTTTFPRLCEVGCYVGAGDRVQFGPIEVKHYRAPGRRVALVEGFAAGDAGQASILSGPGGEGIRQELSGSGGEGIRQELSGPGGEEIRQELSGFDREGAPKELQMVKDPSAHAIPMLRRDFEVSGGKGLASARLYITARGIYDCRINGEPVTDTWLNPGASQYDKHIMYQTYDVSGLLKPGANGIGITLASGWWCDSQTFVLRNYNYYGDREMVLAKLVVEYEDGTRDCYVTNTMDWDYYGEGPYTYAGFFQGEHLDGRRLGIYEDFSKPGFSIEGIKKPKVIATEVIESYSTMPPGFGRPWPKVDHAGTRITGSVNAPVVEVCRLRAKSVAEPRKGLYVYDLGQEIAGVPRIRLRGEAGREVTIRYGEMLYPSLPEYGSLQGMMLTENYRDAESIDRYILKGDPAGEVYCPRFTFHGCRYIEISGIAEPPQPEEVEGIQLSSIPRITGEIETSNPLLNRFIENVKWSQLCNFISIPTDCPQRNERMGWAGDTHVFCRTATYQSDTRLFYYRYLQALADLQEESGQLPNIAPVGGGFGGITYESAMILMVWELYQQYADADVVREYYPAMKKWMQYIRAQGMPGVAAFGPEAKPSFAAVGPLGDWLATEETDNNLIWNAFYGRDAELMERMAGVLGETEDAAYFAGLKQEARDFWNRTFVDPKTGKTRDAEGKISDTQCSYALPLAYHMFSEENKGKAYEHLARKTEETGCRVCTGFFGTGVLNPMLSEGGHTKLAYRLMEQTEYPSWLYPVTQGATTIWERWNSYTRENGFGGNNSMNSFNHYSLGSVLSWIYETVLGIQRDEDQPGYRHFTLAPRMECLEYAKGGFETGYGRIESHWEKDGGGYRYLCRVPENTTATLILPEGAGGEARHELGSGSYAFQIG